MEPGLIKKARVGPKAFKQPYAAIEHRVMDSPAYADLSFSAQALLILLARQLTKDNNNGHLQASFKWCSQYGFGSEHTLRNAIAELIAHGFISRTRSHGANGAWARYAVTWLSIKKRDGLFLDGYVHEAWKHWKPMTNGKSSRQKLPEQSSKKCSFTPKNPAESAGSTPAKNAAYELMPITNAKARVKRKIGHPLHPALLIKSSVTFDRGVFLVTGHGRTLQ